MSLNFQGLFRRETDILQTALNVRRHTSSRMEELTTRIKLESAAQELGKDLCSI